MSTSATRRMLAAYFQTAPPTGFFAKMFSSPPRNFHDTEEVEIDIVRSEEDVSIVITDISAGYRMNAADLYTNKSFKPPIHKEAITINANTLLERIAGDNPFADTTFQARLTARIMQSLPKPERKIRRAIELQASQVLQTGVVSLVDSAGVVLYTIDYKPKATHLPTSAIAWDTAGNTKLADLENLCDVIRQDGLATADQAIFGADAWTEFQKDTTIQALLDNRRMVLGGIAPEARGDGAKFVGFIEVGDCRLEMWIYSGRYNHPQTGVSTRFLSPEKVVVRDSGARMDATFGAIPRIVPPDARVVPFLPPRISNQRGGMDMFVNGWVDQTGENLSVGVGSRPLMIPTAIDTFGCLDTGL
ncbi:major capsid protein [Candidatus Pacearchaeota archaeon]|nr:major capsid protein [Candidatus Pacearchaeota archaeon]